MDFVLPALPEVRLPDWRVARINLTYFWRHGMLPNLQSPETFNEHIQHRKLHDRDPWLPVFADKVAVKQIVADMIGSEWVTPTLWHGTQLPARPEWPLPFVLKARHGCNQSVFVLSGDTDWTHIRRKASKWLASEYGFWLDEWLYAHIPRGLLVEPFIGRGPALPIDYKFFVFGGRVEFIQVHLDRAGRHRWLIFDRDWRRVSPPSADASPLPPDSLVQMIEAAETLGQGFDFVRVDLYDVDEGPRFGEMTFYPGSGLDPFTPVSLDAVFGDFWSRAKAMSNKA